MLRFKSQRIADEWESPHLGKVIHAIVNAAAASLYLQSSKDLTLTCIFRTFDEDAALYHDPHHEPGVHCYWRGVDISTHPLIDFEIESIVSTINSIWQYDPDRPKMKCAIYEDGHHADSSSPHIHVQSHPNTRLFSTVKEGAEATAI